MNKLEARQLLAKLLNLAFCPAATVNERAVALRKARNLYRKYDLEPGPC